MRPLDEWDAGYLDELAPLDETAGLEKKSSLGFDSKKDATKAEIAKQVCAFANPGEGFVVFGFKDKDKADIGLDDGVPDTVGNQSIKDWVEALIPKLHHPPVEGCEARLIQHSTHQPNRGVLVIAVPLSERRPHWTRDDEKAYLRVGAHSAPMRPQTLLDISSRNAAPRGDILDLGLDPKPGGWPENSGNPAFFVRPRICVEHGPVCELWGLELILTRGSGSFRNRVEPESKIQEIQVTVTWDNTLYFRGREPLFPNRPCHAMPFGNEAWLAVQAEDVGFSQPGYHFFGPVGFSSPVAM